MPQMMHGVCFEIACSKLDGFDGFYCAVNKMNNKVEKKTNEVQQKGRCYKNACLYATDLSCANFEC